MTPARERFAWFVALLRSRRFSESELAAGFAESFLEVVPPATLRALSRELADEIGDAPPEVVDDGAYRLSARLETLDAVAWVEPAAPHRFIEFVFRTRSGPIDDPRLAEAPWTTAGEASSAIAVLREEYLEHGLVGVIAGGLEDPSAEPVWTVAGGFADIDAATPMRMEQPMFAGSISKLITAVSVLRLVGEGAIKLADSANSYLGSVRVASNMVTIEQLLTHTSGVSSDFVHYKEKVPAAAELLGESVAVEFRPGSKHAYSNGGYAVLGEIIASVHGLPYGEAVSRAVLEPLGMRASSFVLDWPAEAPRGYVIRAGKLATAPELVPSVPSAGGCTRPSGTSRSSSLWWDRDAGRASIVLVNREHGPAEPLGLDLLSRAL